MLVRTRPDGSKTYYVHGAGLLYDVDLTSTGTETGTRRTYHFDYRGSTVAVTDFAGKVKERIEYSSYGRITQRTGSTSDTPFLFGGEAGVETDANGLYYMHARYYNPHLRRFINADPAGLAGGMNFYAYADGDPISMIDPSGLGATSADRNDQIRNDFMSAYNQKQAETAAIWYTGVQGGSAPPMTGRQMLNTALSFTPGGEAVKALYTQYTYKELGTGAWSQRTDSEIFWQGIEGAAQLAVSLPAAGKALGAVKAPSQPLFIGGKAAPQFTKSNLKIGQQMHRAYKAGLNDEVSTFKEFRLDSGKRIDFLDAKNGIIYELKPNNPRAIKAGNKQLQQYLKEIQTMPRFQGIKWKTVLETY